MNCQIILAAFSTDPVSLKSQGSSALHCDLRDGKSQLLMHEKVPACIKTTTGLGEGEERVRGQPL